MVFLSITVQTLALSAALLTLTGGAVPGAVEPAGQGVEALPQIEAAEYERAAWPEYNDDLYAVDFQGKPLEVRLGQETWLTEKQPLAGKVLVLDFWATWCQPCIAATPRLTALQKAHPEALAVVGVSGQGEDIETVRSYLAEKEPTFAYVHDAEQRVYKPFKSRGIPLVVVVSTDGVVRWMGNPFAKAFQEAVKQTVEADPMVRARLAD